MSEYNIATKALKARNNAWEEQQKEKARKKLNSGIRYNEFLQWVINENNQAMKMVRLYYEERCFLEDGAYNLYLAIEEVFGQVTAKGEAGMSGSEQAISTVDVQLADGTRLKVPFGQINLDALGEGSCINIDYNYGNHTLIIAGKCQARYHSLMDEIVDAMRLGLASNSIYRSQALEISDINHPKIMDISNVDNMFMVLSEKTQHDLKPIYARLHNPERCLENGIPLKYGALFEGGYGTGKTLLALKLAKTAIDNNWVFIYLKDPIQFAECMRMAHVIDRSGNGCVIFVEDIDQVTRGARDAAMQDILNTLDGGDTKDMNVITLFTTNHIELIEPTFLRGKRVDTIISMGGLDAVTAELFIRQSFAVGNYIINDDLTEVCKFIEDNAIVPAFMAVIIEQIKATLVLENNREVKAKDIQYSVESYLHQVELSKTKDLSESPEMRLCNAAKEVFGKDLRITVNGVAEAINYEWNKEIPIK